MPFLSMKWPPKSSANAKTAPTQKILPVHDVHRLSVVLPPLDISSYEDFSSGIFASLSEDLDPDGHRQRLSAHSEATMSSVAEYRRPVNTTLARRPVPSQRTTSLSTRTEQTQRSEEQSVRESVEALLKHASSGSTTLSKQSSSTQQPTPPSSRSSLEPVNPSSHASRSTSSKDGQQHRANSEIPYRGSKSTLILRTSSTSRRASRCHGVSSTSGKNKPLPPEPYQVTSNLDLSQINYRLLESVRVLSPEPVPENLSSHPSTRTTGSTRTRARHLSTVMAHNVDEHAEADRRCSSEGRHVSPKHSMTALLFGQKNLAVTDNAMERIILKVMSSLTSLDDLKAVAMVSKTFYRMFRRYERSLVNRVLFKSCLPAWELRQVMKCEQKRSAFRFKSILRDASTIRALQSFMLMKCQTICRKSTIDGLLGNDVQRKTDLDNAMWRIWTFCKLFGKRRAHASNVHTQTLWLNGGDRRQKTGKSIALGIGNGTGLTTTELEDMSEAWRCMEFLLSGFCGREDEARAAGVFDQCCIDKEAGATETAYLRAWIHDILSLGPKAVLTLVSCSFEQAKVLGVARWTPPPLDPGQLHFLKSAIEYVYRERLVTEARRKANEYEKIVRSNTTRHRTAGETGTVLPRSKSTTQRLRLVTVPYDSNWAAQHRRVRSLENAVVRPDCDPLASAENRRYSTPPLQRPSDPSLHTVKGGVSMQFGPNLFPTQHESPKQMSPDEVSVYPLKDGLPAIAEHPEPPGFNDPIDKAMDVLVNEKGFSELDAKRALSMSDDGRGVNVEKAIGYLTEGSSDPKKADKECRSYVEVAGIPIKLPRLHHHHHAHAYGDHHSFHLGRRSNPPSSAFNKISSRRKGRLNVSSIRKSFSLGVIFDTDEEDESGQQTSAADDEVQDEPYISEIEGTEIETPSHKTSPTHTATSRSLSPLSATPSDRRSSDGLRSVPYDADLGEQQQSSTQDSQQHQQIQENLQISNLVHPAFRNDPAMLHRAHHLARMHEVKHVSPSGYSADLKTGVTTSVVSVSPVSSRTQSTPSPCTSSGLMTFFLSSSDELDEQDTSKITVVSSASSGPRKLSGDRNVARRSARKGSCDSVVSSIASGQEHGLKRVGTGRSVRWKDWESTDTNAEVRLDEKKRNGIESRQRNLGRRDITAISKGIYASTNARRGSAGGIGYAY